jgi:CheY-like chemotaxis protein
VRAARGTRLEEKIFRPMDLKPGGASMLESFFSNVRSRRSETSAPRSLIVIVEANDQTRHHLLRVLGRLDAAPLGFRAGEQALRWLEENRLPALLSVDLALPVMNGARLVELVRANRKLADIPIVVTGGSVTATSDEERAFLAGADAFFPKPLMFEEYLATARTFLGLPSSASTRYERGRQLDPAH